jgi:hypothetical protein
MIRARVLAAAAGLACARLGLGTPTPDAPAPRRVDVPAAGGSVLKGTLFAAAVTELERVRFVMKGGKVYVRSLP